MPIFCMCEEISETKQQQQLPNLNAAIQSGVTVE